MVSGRVDCQCRNFTTLIDSSRRNRYLTAIIVKAARLAPDNARYAYVEAIAVHSAGRRSAALALLRSANQRHPNDLDILSALISISREAGDQRAALRYARKAAEILPDDQGVTRLVAELEGR